MTTLQFRKSQLHPVYQLSHVRRHYFPEGTRHSNEFLFKVIQLDFARQIASDKFNNVDRRLCQSEHDT